MPALEVPRNESEHTWLQCGGCRSIDIEIVAVGGSMTHEYVMRACENCGRRWTTISRFETSRITVEGQRDQPARWPGAFTDEEHANDRRGET